MTEPRRGPGLEVLCGGPSRSPGRPEDRPRKDGSAPNGSPAARPPGHARQRSSRPAAAQRGPFDSPGEDDSPYIRRPRIARPAGHGWSSVPSRNRGLFADGRSRAKSAAARFARSDQRAAAHAAVCRLPVRTGSSRAKRRTPRRARGERRASKRSTSARVALWMTCESMAPSTGSPPCDDQHRADAWSSCRSRVASAALPGSPRRRRAGSRRRSRFAARRRGACGARGAPRRQAARLGHDGRAPRSSGSRRNRKRDRPAARR